MQFVFRRDEEGVERIYVGDVCVGRPKGMLDPEFLNDFVVVDVPVADNATMSVTTEEGES